MNNIDHLQTSENKLGLSIVIPTRNGNTYLLDCVNSIVGNQLHNYPNVDVTISDNNSNQITQDVISSIKAKYQNIKVSRSDVDLSMCQNWNRAFTLGEYNYVYMIHDDDKLAPSFLNEIMPLIGTNQFDLVVVDAELVDANGKRIEIMSSQTNKFLIEQTLEKFPGVQRQIWKRSCLSVAFDDSFFPIFDYVAYALNLKYVHNATKLSKPVVTVRKHPEQITNKIFWTLPILKASFFLLTSSFPANSKRMIARHMKSALNTGIRLDRKLILKKIKELKIFK